MPAANSFDLIETETTEVKVKSSSSDECSTQTSCEPECPPKCPTEKKCYDPSAIAMWIIALVLIIIWVCALWSVCSSGFGSSDSDDCDTECGWGSSGYIIGFIIWIILVVIFLAAIYSAGWWAIMFFLIITIIFAVAGCWCKSSSKKKCGTSC